MTMNPHSRFIILFAAMSLSPAIASAATSVEAKDLTAQIMSSASAAKESTLRRNVEIYSGELSRFVQNCQDPKLPPLEKERRLITSVNYARTELARQKPFFPSDTLYHLLLNQLADTETQIHHQQFSLACKSASHFESAKNFMTRIFQ